MAEIQEKAHVIMRATLTKVGPTTLLSSAKPVKVYDDRDDARDYARRMNRTAKRYRYTVVPVKKG